MPGSLEEPAEQPEDDLPAGSARRGKKRDFGVLAGGVESGARVAGTVGDAVTLLEGVLRSAPPKELRVLLERVLVGRGLYLYVR